MFFRFLLICLIVFCLRPLQHVADRGANQVPRWVRSIAQSIAGKTHVYKALKELEQESKQMRDAINDIGQHLCESNGLKLRWEGIKGLDGDI